MSQNAIRKKSSTRNRKPAAEDTLNRKYWDTLNMMNAMRNKGKGGKKTTINIKKTTVMHANDADPFSDSLNKGHTATFDSLEGNMNANATINVTRIQQDQSEATDFLMAKFGVQGHMKDQVAKPELGAENKVSFQGGLQGSTGNRDGISLTNQIFVEEKATVLDLETKQGELSWGPVRSRHNSNKKDPKLEISGFKNYVEQEEIDRATANDLIVTTNSPTKLTLTQPQPSHPALLAAALRQSNLKAPSVKFQDTQTIDTEMLEERSPAKKKDHFSWWSKTTKNVLDVPILRGNSLSLQRNGTNASTNLRRMSQNEGRKSGSTSRQDSSMMSRPNPEPATVSQQYQGGVTPAKFQEEASSFFQSSKRRSTHLERASTIEVEDQPSVTIEPSEQPSNMAGFVHQAQAKSNVPADYQTVQLPQHFNLMSRKEGKVQQTINQDSMLIKHEFDAGRSKLTQRIEQTNKAQIRMQQLMTMLKHKDAKVTLQMSDQDDGSENETVEDYQDGKVYQNVNQSNEEDLALKNSGSQRYMQTKDFDQFNAVGSKSLNQNDEDVTEIGESKDLAENGTKLLQYGKTNDLNGDGNDEIGEQSQKDDDHAGTSKPSTASVSIASGLEKKRLKQVHGLKSTKDDQLSTMHGRGSFLGRLADEEIGSSSNQQSRLHPAFSKSLNHSFLKVGLAGGRAKLSGTDGENHNLRMSGVAGGVALRPKMQIINTGLLTSVPKRGRMIDTQKYIRQNLQPYADSEFIGFATKPRGLKPFNTKALWTGDLEKSNLQTLEPKGFFSQVNYPSTATHSGTQQLKVGGRRVRSSVKANKKNNDYEPFIMPKKRTCRNIRIRRSRDHRNSKNFRSLDVTAQGMLTITEETDKNNMESVVDVNIDAEDVDDLAGLVSQNFDLKGQLEHMVMLFEQYVKVATLKEKADRMNARRKSENDSPMKGGSVPVMEKELLNRTMNDNVGKPLMGEVQDEQYPMMTHVSQPTIMSENLLSAQKEQPLNRSHERLKTQSCDNLALPKNESIGQKDPFKQSSIGRKKIHALSPRKQQEKQEKMLVSIQMKDGFFMNHHMPFIKNPVDNTRVTSHQPRNILDASYRTTDVHTIMNSNARSVATKIVLPLSPRNQIKQSQLSILAVNEHKTHNEWLRKIQAIWDTMFNACNYDEIGRVETELQIGQRNLKMLKQDNMRSNAKMLDIHFKTMTRVKQQVSGKGPIGHVAKKVKIFSNKIAALQERISAETERSYTLNTWGINHMVITTLMKVRLLEDIIDCAQKQKVRPDVTMERELYLMRYLQAQTEKDTRNFIQERDSDRWRRWDNPRRVDFVKPDAEENPDEEKIRTILGYMYTMETETIFHTRICQEMIEFLNYCFDSEAWYTLWSLKYHRESNQKRQEDIAHMQSLKLREQQISQASQPSQKSYRSWHERSQQPVEVEEAKVKLNWLQLTENQQNMQVIGPDPLWLQYIRQANEKRYRKVQEKKMEDDEMAKHEAEAGEIQAIEAAGISVRKASSVVADEEDDVVRVVSDDEAGVEEDEVLFDNAVGLDIDSHGSYGKEEEEDIKSEKKTPELTEEERLALEREAARAQSAEEVERQRREDEELLRLRKNWRDTIDNQKIQSEKEKKRLEEARAKRLARLFKDDDLFGQSESSDEDEPLFKQLDYGSAATGIDSLIDKVEVHLQVEMNILRKWKDKDFDEIKLGKKKPEENLPVINSSMTKRQKQTKTSMGSKKNSRVDNSLLDRRAFRRSIERGPTKQQTSIKEQQKQNKTGRSKSTRRNKDTTNVYLATTQ